MPKILTPKKTHTIIISSLFTLTLLGSISWFMIPPIVTEGDTKVVVQSTPYPYTGKHVIIHLNDMTITLRDSTTTMETFPLLSQGKPGSYYETIGGVYKSDYKLPLHFSSIGHVYMPYSIHLFGNYFIHGVPYYPDGTPVSSTFSGGCIRLTNDAAKTVYDFIEKGTPVIITRDTELSFYSTSVSTSTLTSVTVTNLMAASISLEALTQDNKIIGVEGEETTRRNILPRLVIDGNTAVTTLYAQSIGEGNFVHLMNQKAMALGLSNTHFINATSSVTTTYEDQERFMRYIATYKSYLLEIRE